MAAELFSELAQATAPNDDGSDRRAVLAKCRVGESLHLVPQTDNLYDTHVVRVCRENMEQLGCLDIDVKYQVFAALVAGQDVACRIERLGDGNDPNTPGALLAIKIHGQSAQQRGCLSATALVLLLAGVVVWHLF